MVYMRLAIIGAVVAAAISTTVADDSKATVEINGKAVFPSHGTAAGVWFFHNEELGTNSPQLLLLGFPEPTPKYRIVAALNPGDKIQINSPNDPPIIFEAKAVSQRY
jgi:hypothetical protein